MRRKFQLVSMGGRVEGRACADQGVRTHIGAYLGFMNMLAYHNSEPEANTFSMCTLCYLYYTKHTETEHSNCSGILSLWKGKVSLRMKTSGKVEVCLLILPEYLEVVVFTLTISGHYFVPGCDHTINGWPLTVQPIVRCY